jgi:high-affinity iron transporter
MLFPQVGRPRSLPNEIDWNPIAWIGFRSRTQLRVRGRFGEEGSAVLPTFVIGLREGLEASLIVGIIAAFLIQRRERAALRPMWIGVAIAIGLCTAVAIVLRLVGESLPLRQREFMEGTLALVAVAGVTYMVVWMRRHSRELKGQLEGHAERALMAGSTLALVGMAFLAVLREGLETAVFMLAAFQSSRDPLSTGTGAALGVVVAVGLGYAIYRGGVRINLSRFFRITGFVLVLVAAGLLSTAVHEFAEAGALSFGQQTAFDLSWLVRPGSVRESLLTGMLGLQAVPNVAEVAAWLLYGVPMSIYVLWPQRPGRTQPAAAPA